MYLGRSRWLSWLAICGAKKAWKLVHQLPSRYGSIPGKGDGMAASITDAKTHRHFTTSQPCRYLVLRAISPNAAFGHGRGRRIALQWRGTRFVRHSVYLSIMLRFFAGLLSVLAFFACPTLLLAQTPPQKFRAGALTSNITPPWGATIIGGFHAVPCHARSRRAARPLPGAGRRHDQACPRRLRSARPRPPGQRRSPPAVRPASTWDPEGERSDLATHTHSAASALGRDARITVDQRATNTNVRRPPDRRWGDA